MKKIILYFFTTLLLSSSLIYTQNNIKGKVYNEQTKEPVENVIIKEFNSRNKTITRPDGSFIIEVTEKLPGKLIFKRLGYKDEELIIEDVKIELNVYLSEKLTGTDEIEVNSSIFSKSGLLNGFYLNSGINTIDELISKSPGLTVIKRGNYASEPVLRGLNSDRIYITIDGMKIQSACTDKMDPVTSYAETGNLESIEISKGSFSCGKCLNKQAGIDLKLKDAATSNKLKLSGSLGAGYLTAANGRNIETRISIESKKYGTTANFVYKANGDYTSGDGTVVKYSGYNKINLANSNIFTPLKNLTIKADLLYDYAWNIGYPALTMDVKTAEAVLAGISFKINNLTQALKSMEGRLYYNSVNHVMDDTHRDNRIKMDMPGLTKTKGIYVSTNLFTGSINTDIKFDATTTTARAEMTMYVPGSAPMFMLTWPDVKKNEYVISVNSKRNFGTQFLFTAGGSLSLINSSIEDILGYGELSVFYPSFSGTDSRPAYSIAAGFNMMISNYLNTELNYAYNSRDLSISEQYAFYIFNRLDAYDYIGDPFLKNEKSHQIELTLKYNRDRFKTYISLFTYRFSDYIIGITDNNLSPMTEGANGVKIYSNIPTASLTGFESTIEAGITGKLNLVNTVQYTRGTDNSGNSLPQVPPLMGTTALRFSDGKISLQTEAIWAAAQNNFSIKYGETRTPSFAIFNFRVSYKILNYLTLNAGIENVLNKNYYEHLDWLKIPRPGRNFYFTFKTVF